MFSIYFFLDAAYSLATSRLSMVRARGVYHGCTTADAIIIIIYYYSYIKADSGLIHCIFIHCTNHLYTICISENNKVLFKIKKKMKFNINSVIRYFIHK